jgi:hypothetical protein
MLRRPFAVARRRSCYTVSGRGGCTNISRASSSPGLRSGIGLCLLAHFTQGSSGLSSTQAALIHLSSDQFNCPDDFAVGAITGITPVLSVDQIPGRVEVTAAAQGVLRDAKVISSFPRWEPLMS